MHQTLASKTPGGAPRNLLLETGREPEESNASSSSKSAPRKLQRVLNAWRERSTRPNDFPHRHPAVTMVTAGVLTGGTFAFFTALYFNLLP